MRRFYNERKIAQLIDYFSNQILGEETTYKIKKTASNI